MIFIFLPHDVSLDQLRAIRKDGIKFGIAKRHGCWADAPAESLGGSREQPRHSCQVYQPARLPSWLDGVVPVRYRVAHIFDPELPAGLGLAPLIGGHPELPVSSPERALLELLSETGSFESLEEVRQLVESTRNLRLPLLDQLLSHLTRIKVVRLAALLAGELALPWAELAQQHSRRLGGGRRWVAVGRTGERLDLAATPLSCAAD
jgi:hypothetical protein